MDRLARALGLVGIAGILVLLPLWLRMLISPAPQEMREGAMLLSTLAWLEGRNPWSLETLPFTANLYGPLYPLITTPVTWALGPGLVAHRLVDGIGIALACAILFRVLRRMGVDAVGALGGTLLNAAGLLYWVGPASRPDGVGMALSIGALAMAAGDPLNGRRFAIVVLLSVLGFATKLYYVLPMFVASLWILCFADRWLGLIRLAMASGALLIAIAGLGLGLPAWAPTVLGANLQAAHYSWEHLARQSRDWAIFSLPLLAAAIACVRPRRRAGLEGVVTPAASLSGSARARPPGLDVWDLALAVGMLAVMASLGGHRGAHMTYLFHLVSPPLTVVVLRAAHARRGARLAFAATLPLAVILNAHWFAWDLDRLHRAETAFARAQQWIATARHPTGTAEFAPLLIAAGHSPIETGHSEFLETVSPPPWLAPLWPPRDRVDAAMRRGAEQVWNGIARGAFDVVLANRRDLGLITTSQLETTYRRVDTLDLDMWWAGQRWPADVWVPQEQAQGSGPWAPGLNREPWNLTWNLEPRTWNQTLNPEP